MQKLVIIGNAISADIMFGYLKSDSRYKPVAFSADADYIQEPKKFGLDVVNLSVLPEYYPPTEYRAVMAVGYSNLNQNRKDIFDRVKVMGYTIESYIHPDAKVFNDNQIGEGSIVMANSVIEVYTSIGKNSVVWANCTIGHHSKVGDNCWIASGTVLAGETTIQNNCFLGVNVTISHQVTVGESNLIGSHTAIHKNTKENEVYLSPQGEKHRFPAKDYAKHILK